MQNLIKKYRWISIVSITVYMFIGMFPSLWSLFQAAAVETYGITLSESATILSISTAFAGIFYIIGGQMSRKLSSGWLARIGLALIALGIFDLSVAGYGTTIMKLYIIFSMPFGAGCGIGSAGFTPYLMKWYPDKKGYAMGVMSFAYSIIMMGETYVVKYLMNQGGMVFTLRILFITAVILGQAAASFVVDPDEEYIREKAAEGARLAAARNKDKKAESTESMAGRVDFSTPEMLKTPQYWLLMLAGMFSLPAYQLMAASIVTIGVSRGLSETAAVSLVAVSLGTSAFGKFIVPSWSDKVGRKKASVIFLALVSVSSVWMLFAHGYSLFIAYNVLIFVYGGWGTMITPFSYDLFGFKYANQNIGFVTAYNTIGSFALPVLVSLLTPVLLANTSYIICIAGAVLATVCIILLDPDTSKLKSAK